MAMMSLSLGCITLCKVGIKQKDIADCLLTEANALFQSWSPVHMQINEKEEAQQQVTSLKSQVQSRQADSSAKIEELQAAAKTISSLLPCLL